MKNTKDMPLDEVWDLCQQLWDWIAEQIKAGDNRSVVALKVMWCYEHGYGIVANCFFCDSAHWQSITFPHCPYCPYCPGKLVDPEFACQALSYDYAHEPLEFHAKLTEMHEQWIRRSHD